MSASRRAAGASLLALGVLLGACGIPHDKTPQQLADADIGQLGATAAAGSSSTQGGQRVYFLAPTGPGDGFRLQAVSRDVPANAADVLSELFKGVTDAEKAQRRLSSQIPVGTKLQSVNPLADGTVVVSVDSTIFRAQNNLFAAVAQIVYTATSLPGTERVRLLVDGGAKQWPGDDRVERTGDLTPLAYPTLYPVSQPDLPPVPSPTGPTTTATFAVTTLPLLPSPPTSSTTTTAAPPPPGTTTTAPLPTTEVPPSG